MLEGVNLAVVGAASLGKDDNRHAFLQTLLGIVHGLDNTSCRVVVNHDVPRHLARPTHQREIVEALAHHPLEIVAQIAVNREDVVGSLMVGNEDVGAVAVDEMTILDLDLHPKEEAHGPTPPLGRIIAPIVVVEEAANDSDDACDDSEHQHNGRSYAIMVQAVKDINFMRSFH